jgi:hypothetical protein
MSGSSGDGLLGFGPLGGAPAGAADRPPDALPPVITEKYRVAAPNLLGRVAAAIRRNGTRIILRNPTQTRGPVQHPYPPTLDGAVLDGAQRGGATLISIRADEALGLLVPGDEITVGGAAYLVVDGGASRSYDAASPGFDNIRISPPLVADLADGAPMTFVWSTDQYLWAKIQSVPSILVDGSLFMTEDLQVTIAAKGATPPSLAAKLIIGSDTRAIVSRRPVYANGYVTMWQLQAR